MKSWFQGPNRHCEFSVKSTVQAARFDELLQIQRELLELEIERIEAVVGQNKAVSN
jgi:hypothetical protein